MRRRRTTAAGAASSALARLTTGAINSGVGWRALESSARLTSGGVGRLARRRESSSVATAGKMAHANATYRHNQYNSYNMLARMRESSSQRLHRANHAKSPVHSSDGSAGSRDHENMFAC